MYVQFAGGKSSPCKSCIGGYHDTQIVEIFHILQLFLIYHLYWGWMPWNSHYLSFFHIHFHSKASSKCKESIHHGLQYGFLASIMIIWTFHRVNFLSSYSEVFNPFSSFLRKVLAVKLHSNQWQRASLSNSASHLHTCYLSLVQSHFHTAPCTIYPSILFCTSQYQFLLGSALVKFPCSNAFCQSKKQAHNSSTMSKVHSDIIPSIPISFSSSKYVFMYKKINQLTTTVMDMITRLCKTNS